MPSSSDLSKRLMLWVVVRVVHFLGDGLPNRSRITIREILPTREEAEAEVSRLQKLKPIEDCEYFVTPAKFFPERRGVEVDY